MLWNEKIPTQLLLEGVVAGSEDNRDLPPKSKQDEETQRMLASAKRREYRENNHQKLRDIEKRSKLRHREKILAKQKTEQHRARAAEHMRRWRQRHPDRVNKQRQKWCEYQKHRRLRDPLFALKHILATRIRCILKGRGLKKHQKTFNLIGCTAAEAKMHIEAQFQEGMDWSHRKSFHLDHWIPLAVFDLFDSEERQWAFNYQNLRPLSPSENMRKHTAIPSPLPSWLPPHIAARIESRRK